METENARNAFTDPVRVERWPTESRLKITIILISIAAWILLLVTVFGFIYAVFIGLFFFVSHLTFIAYVRGNAVKLGPEQFPELYERVCELSQKAGLRKIPEAYIMQAGGVLNALATKLGRSKMIIIYSDMLDACGENEGACDMIIGHEIGHLKAGHLNGIWFLLPGLFFPFLGSAYSRAREFTCDRFGMALCGNSDNALRGLAILSAGGKMGPEINLTAFTDQRYLMNNGFMTIGRWLSSHPPLCDRIAALQPDISRSGMVSYTKGTVQALLLVVLTILIPTVIIAGTWGMLSKKINRRNTLKNTTWQSSPDNSNTDDFSENGSEYDEHEE